MSVPSHRFGEGHLSHETPLPSSIDVDQISNPVLLPIPNGNDMFQTQGMHHPHAHPHSHLHANQGYLAITDSSPHTLAQMREPYGTDQLLLKHMDMVGQYGVPDMGGGGGGPDSPGGSPDRKRRRMNGEQQQKRHKYDVLKSFFRVYFKVDNQSMVLKDAIYNLYQRKIPTDSRIARNAMYRHMWCFFRDDKASFQFSKDDKISAFQSNYREYIKGIKLISGAPGSDQPLAYDGFEKDVEVLESVGVNNLFDFHEEELAKSSSETNVMMNPQMPMPLSHHPPPPPSTHSPDLYLKGDSEEEIISYVEMLETQAKNHLVQISQLKSKLIHRKHNKSK